MTDTEHVNLNLEQSDFFWTDKEQLPLHWYDGAFHGNGRLGSCVYFDIIDDTVYIHVELCCNEVYDRRTDGKMLDQFESPRLPVAHLLYECSGNIIDFKMHTDIHSAITDLYIKTDNETIICNFYVCAKRQVIVIEQNAGNIKKWELIPAEAISPRQVYGIEHNEGYRMEKDYRYNPLPKVDKTEEKVVCIQELDNDFHTITLGKRNKDHVFFTIRQGEKLTRDEVEKELDAEIMGDFKKEHCQWWNDYYPISGMEVPDPSIQTFYWRQVYKLGSAVREESIVLDNQGPWLFETPWPGTWWNLNVQLSYWPLYTSNRLDQAKSLNNHIIKFQDDLIENVPEEYRFDSAGIGTATTWSLKCKVANPLADNKGQFVELGNLTWTLHNCWLYYRMTMDTNILRELIYPLLTRAVNYYLHFLKKEGGKWHLAATESPEYGEKCEDCNYDLAMLKWGCDTLLKCTELLGVKNEKESIWKDVRDNLTEFSVNETGYMIGKDLPYQKTHRHFSHLMMHMPLYLVNRDNSDSWDLLKHSIDHWFSYDGDILGFSNVGASLLCSAYKQGDLAFKHIQELMKKNITYNTMYLEEGPVIETPLGGMESIQQLLLQSWGDKIRVFPAMPSAWKDASFWRFAAQGGFVVSASYKNGRTEWIQIESKTDSSCKIESDIFQADIIFEDKKVENIELENYEVSIRAGETIYIKNRNL